MRPFSILLLLILCLPAWAGEPSQIFATHPGPSLSKTEEIKAKKPVFILYQADVRASLTSDFHQNVQRILEALRPQEEEGEDRAFLERVRKFIPYDLDLPRRSAEIETAHLRDQLCSPRSRFPSNVAIFQNSVNPSVPVEKGYDMDGSWEFCKAESPQPFTYKYAWKIKNIGALAFKPAWGDQLYSHPDIFIKAMESVFEVFPPDSHRYLLMIKGRGDAEYLLKVQYAFDTAGIDPLKLRQAFLSRKAEFGEKPWEFEMAARYSNLVQSILAEQLPPLEKDDAQGLSKWFALETLAEWGGGDPTKGAYFSKVYLNTSGGMLETSPQLKKWVSATDYTGLNVRNIGGLRHFGLDGADPLIPFEKLSPFFGPDLSFEERLEQFLDRLAQQGIKP